MIINDFTNKKWEIDCIGCSIANRKMLCPGGMIYENESCYIHQDPAVPIEGFLIVGTKRHIQRITDLSKKEYSDLSFLIYEGRNLINTIVTVKNITIIQEEGSSHLHFWLFPWHDWMIKKYGKESLDYIRTITKDAKTTLNTPEHIRRIIDWVEEFKIMIEKKNTKNQKSI